MQHTEIQSPNFYFLKEHDAQLLEYAARAERYALDDPNTCLIKLRQLAEALAEDAAAYSGLQVEPYDDFTNILRNLDRRKLITREMANIFHGIRKAGNKAAHEGGGSRHDAVRHLKLAHRLAVWFHRAFRDPHFSPRPFVLPSPANGTSAEVVEELERLRKARWDAEREVDATEDALQRARHDQQTAEARAEAMFAELETALALAEETEARQAALAREHAATVARLRTGASEASGAEIAARNRQAREAAAAFDLSESEAREQIDAALRAGGWEADSIVRTWQHGARPEAGRNMAIAFVPAGDGYADYVLYCGMKAAGVVEAKRRNLDLRAALEEAANHARAYRAIVGEGELNPGRAPGVPLLFASNGRPFISADDTKHGVWFRDTRANGKKAQAREHWPTPDELRDLL